MQLLSIAVAGLMLRPTPQPPRAGLLRPPPIPPRTGPIHAKITGAALAAAFAAKNDDGPSPTANLTLAEKEAAVIEAIRECLDAGRNRQPKRIFSALGAFGNASGVLAQTWLTPQQLERCCFFWWAGWQLSLRELSKGNVFTARGLQDIKATPWFVLLCSQTFPWTPLLVPLVSRAVGNSTDTESDASSFVPTSFSDQKITALQRLMRDDGLVKPANTDFITPQNIDQGVAFFRDGSKMFVRDLTRGRLLSYGDSPATYVWFGLLTLSTLPLTPLLLPLIDKRREDGSQSDYVPASFRQRRLAAFARYSAAQAVEKEEKSEKKGWWPPFGLGGGS
jgi:hypothetical protein